MGPPQADSNKQQEELGSAGAASVASATKSAPSGTEKQDTEQTEKGIVMGITGKSVLSVWRCRDMLVEMPFSF